ncbi:primosomal protein N' [Actinoalloteichus caeruleus]|uniref:primosomal protein N' n=1 Tax=Actinoalloteichus cyanogriseus TaxID=2893586 RepID=UPI0004C1371C|nr:primosomal protein N' [Actinoalloteichus caeruleus]
MAGRDPGRRGERRPAERLPIARVCVDLSNPHLNHAFDYLVPADLDEDAAPGVRVRVRFAGQHLDGFLLERVERSEVPPARLVWLERVVSPEPVFDREMAELTRTLADRYAGSHYDLLRLAVPPRHARVEREPVGEPAPDPAPPPGEAWDRYPLGGAFLEAVRGGRPARAVWQAMPGEDWPARLAELAAAAASTGRGALLVVPDYRDLRRVGQACASLMGPDVVATLSADLGPAKRYRQWLRVSRGQARVVVGTRAAALAPVRDPGLVAIWDDGDEEHAFPRVPYPHVREILTTRARVAGSSLLVGAFTRSVEAQLFVESGWAREIAPTREQVRVAAPRVDAAGDETQLARDPAARSARLPGIAFEAARAALSSGAPVLVQVPRRGYVPALACASCRAPARCRRCAGPLALPAGDDGTPLPPACRWCGSPEAGFRCAQCGSRRLRATVVGARRTAEELGRAFPGAVVRTSGGEEVLHDVPAGPALVVCTPGAEPVVPGGYGAALLLDGWALLGRPNLRAAEEALRRWFTAAALVRPAGEGGRVVVVADPGLSPVRALVRWAPAWHASRELAERRELGFPPTVRMCALDGGPAALAEMLDTLTLPPTAEVLGPVPVEPRGAPGPGAGGGDDAGGPRERVLLRVPVEHGRELVAAVAAATAVRSARKDTEVVRVRVDPPDPL